MANLTLSIPDEILRQARIEALKRGTSVNELVRVYLKQLAGSEDRIREAMDRVLENSARYHGRIRGGKFRREETYDRGADRGR
jgi:hypothetical protein